MVAEGMIVYSPSASDLAKFRDLAQPAVKEWLAGELGERVLENVSEQGWQQWLERLVLIINENQLSTADPKHVEFIEEQMLGFLFQEGDGGGDRQG